MRVRDVQSVLWTSSLPHLSGNESHPLRSGISPPPPPPPHSGDLVMRTGVLNRGRLSPRALHTRPDRMVLAPRLYGSSSNFMVVEMAGVNRAGEICSPNRIRTVRGTWFCSTSE
ncbi:hypothetical protein CEXT_467041 [Caerostris extrusa]|uniref:Uncharacterized protein n=1 Tax=Caerostris extrusa TaxID=172846 RepID=A0AAV4ULT1_CAEEX|nr:hypothetical protein CEXT_467041 [Caerostris extrusa]